MLLRALLVSLLASAAFLILLAGWLTVERLNATPPGPAMVTVRTGPVVLRPLTDSEAADVALGNALAVEACRPTLPDMRKSVSERKANQLACMSSYFDAQNAH